LSDIGVFAVHRGIWTHPLFADDAFTEREAWLWLISHAVWKPTRVRVSHKIVSLDRGQLAFSIRFLAEKWKWSKSSVHRFLARLRDENMIEQKAGQELTHITICNYNKYAFDGDAGRDRNGTGTGQPRDKEEEGKKVIIDDGGGTARAKLVSDEAQDTADAMAAACGFPDPKACPFGWYGAAIWVQKCLNEGWQPALMIEGTKATAARKRDGPIESYKYLEKPLARFIAEQSRPLPQVEIREVEKVVAYGHGKHNSNSVIAAIDRQLAALQKTDGVDLEMPESVVLRLPGGSVR
jgi:hypothetical protein